MRRRDFVLGLRMFKTKAEKSAFNTLRLKTQKSIDQTFQSHIRNQLMQRKRNYLKVQEKRQKNQCVENNEDVKTHAKSYHGLMRNPNNKSV